MKNTMPARTCFWYLVDCHRMDIARGNIAGTPTGVALWISSVVVGTLTPG